MILPVKVTRLLACACGLVLLTGCPPSDDDDTNASSSSSSGGSNATSTAGSTSQATSSITGSSSQEGRDAGPSCVTGDQGCACYGNLTCNSGADGGLLVCINGLCHPPTCDVGEIGCGCLPDATCVPGAVCQAGRCMPEGCQRGTEGCPCTEAGGCADGLACQSNLCVDGTGFPGHPCFFNDTCRVGARCDTAQDICLACNQGEKDCQCLPNGTCASGLVCRTGTCVETVVETPPANPKCYTPCRTGLVRADGTWTECVDGLLAGCIGGNVCANGSCVPPLSADGGSILPILPPPAATPCTTDSQCPEFQACIAGGCYSNCEDDGECNGSDMRCHKHVCRKKCAVGAADTCENDSTCSPVGNSAQTGVCMPVQPATGQSTPVDGTFYLSKTSLSFSNVRINDSLVIVNDSNTLKTFTITKFSHTEHPSTGQVIVTEHPMPWLKMGAAGASGDGGTEQVVAQETFTVNIEANAERRIKIEGAATPHLSRWEGVITVSNDSMGTREINLTYVSRPEGQWGGRMFYFGTFSDTGLKDWVADKSNNTKLLQVENAFIQNWASFKAGNLTSDQFRALVSSTLTESWKSPLMRQFCNNDNWACYPYDNAAGYMNYTSNVSTYKIPTGGIELPIGINLRISDADTTGKTLAGKIATAATLHYSGDPAISLVFNTTTTACPVSSAGVTLCQLNNMSTGILVGGRYVTTGTDTGCTKGAKRNGASTYGLSAIPWLIPGFEANTQFESTSKRRYRYECRDNILPQEGDSDAIKKYNRAFSAANPIPDARTRQRTLELIDGALINQEELFIIFKESFPSFLDGSDSSGFSAYGLMRLNRTPAQLDATAYTGNNLSETRTFESNMLKTSCSANILTKAKVGTFPTTDEGIRALASTVVNGVASTATLPQPLSDTGTEKVHWICYDTGLINGGKDASNPISCPGGSEVRYFTTKDATFDPTTLTCQDGFAADTVLLGFADAGPASTTNSTINYYDTATAGNVNIGTIKSKATCLTDLNTWRNTNKYSIRMDPVWQCQRPSTGVDGGVGPVQQAYCSEDRRDLRKGKDFFPETATVVAFPPLQDQVDHAFRYKADFRSRSNTSLGFTPSICVPDSNERPYCYDPKGIEEVQQRIDCALYLYTDKKANLDAATSTTLRNYLKTNFAFEKIDYDSSGHLRPVPIIHEGFERQYSELLVMLGDDAYTNAFASRFDLAGTRLDAFQGSLFEPGGIDLSGGAGFEMANLYKAVQYYDLALERFYTLAPHMWTSLCGSACLDTTFITKDSVTSYFDRVVRASTQRAAALSEIARRYQNFNRPDLARNVVMRAYTSAYLESIVFARMMLRLEGVVLPDARPQIVERVEFAQRSYRKALLDMRDQFANIQDKLNFFGFPPDYIPFPALEEGDSNAFQLLFDRAANKTAVAGEKEVLALDNLHGFDTDMASFESELVSIRQNYEDQLAQLCGTFVASDGHVYPAIKKYAYMDPFLRQLEDPCGMVKHGDFYNALGAVDLARLDLLAARQVIIDNAEAIKIEKDRVTRMCNLISETANYEFSSQQAIDAAQAVILESQAAKEHMDRVATATAAISSAFKCGGTDCFAGVVAGIATTVAYTVAEFTAVGMDVKIRDKEAEIAQKSRDTAKWVTNRDCDYAKVDSDAAMKNMILQATANQIEALKANQSLSLAVGELVRLRNLAKRLEDEQAEQEQLVINIEAARNDPNVRIYKNDSVITADRTFRDALREAYRATKVYEYYTSQSYAHLNDLFLARMVSHGDVSLENYLAQLSNAFDEFQEQYGNPDLRVTVLSLRDDVLNIPQLGLNNLPLTSEQRKTLFRNEIANVKYLDARGYITLPFNTTLAQLSPLTRNHKLHHLQVQLVGLGLGDDVGRVYLRQRGTGMVRDVNGEKIFYTFPERSAVVNVFFDEKVFDESLYSNTRLRDRPYVNTHWEVVLNQRDEWVNRDINLQAIDDVLIYLFYTDFTEL